MGILLKLVHKIIGNSIIETKIELQGDMFIEVPVEKSDNFIIEKVEQKNDTIILTTTEKTTLDCEIEIEPIGNTEQLSSSEKPNNHIKTKKCLFCDELTTGTICEKDECFEKFEKL